MPDDGEDEDERATEAATSSAGMLRPHTTEGYEFLRKTKAKKHSEEQLLKSTLSEEKALRSKVIKLRAELLRSRSVTAMHRSAMSALKSSDREKEMMNSRKGLDHLKKGGAKELKKAKPASEADLVKLSASVKQYHRARFGALDVSLRNCTPAGVERLPAPYPYQVPFVKAFPPALLGCRTSIAHRSRMLDLANSVPLRVRPVQKVRHQF